MELSVPQKHFGPSTFFVATLVFNFATILALDMYIPALPAMQADFGVSVATLNLTFFAFQLCAAFFILISGTLSDRFGRKPLLLVSFVTFVASSLGCALSPNVVTLVACRMGQSLGFGMVITVTTAVIKDAYEGESLKQAMSLYQSLIIVGPVLAPFLGAFLIDWWGWRAVFWCLAALGAIALGLVFLMNETHRGSRAISLSPKAFFAPMGGLFKQRRFMGLTLVMTFAGFPFFAFAAVVSYVFIDFFALDYGAYAFGYALTSLASVIAPFVYLRLSRVMTHRWILVIAIVLIGGSGLGLWLWGARSPVLFIAILLPFFLAEGIVRPLVFVDILEQPPDRVGAASALANFSYNLLAAFSTVLATLSFWPNFIVALAVITVASSVAMAVAFGLSRR